MKQLTWVLMLLAAFVSCNKDELSEYPKVFTGEVTAINEKGATFSAKIMALGNEPIVEYGFVWDRKMTPTIENAERYVIRGGPNTGVVSAHIATTLQPGFIYYVRAYIRNRHFTTYGKEVAFTSLGSMSPAVHGFMPTTANIGDTVHITGDNFSYTASKNRVKFNDFDATVFKSTQDTLWVLVPANLNVLTSKISVSLQGNEASATGNFTLSAPVVEDFQPKSGLFGSSVTITGKNFAVHPASLRVYFDEVEADITASTDQSLVVTVPNRLEKRESTVRVEMNNLSAVANGSFRLAPLVLQDFTPKVAVTGSTITLTGSNFSPLPASNKVTIGGLNAVVLSASITTLEVVVPLQNAGHYPSRNAAIQVEVVGERVSYPETLIINDQWFRLKNAPIAPNQLYSSGYTLANCFTYNNKAYVGLNNNTDFWEYDPANDTWARRANFPGTPRWYGTGFVIGDKIYFGTGSGNNRDLKDWWEYDIPGNRWTQKNDFGGENRTGAVSFQHQNAGYVGTGFLWNVFYYHHGFTDFWKYTPSNDSWEKSFDYPIGMWWGTAFTHANKPYIGLGNIMLSGFNLEKTINRYDFQSQSFQKVPDFPMAGGNNRSVVFSMGDKIYVRTAYSKDFYSYSEGASSWTRVPTGILSDIGYGIAFSVGDKAYVGLGRENVMWEYDPSR